MNRKLIFTLIWIALLMGYVLAGLRSVPFHGDESTTIWMSKDYEYTIAADFERLRYTQPPLNAEEQHLRLVTGSLTKYFIGVSRNLHGYGVDDINEQWHWGFDWDWNVMNGHMPTDSLLMASRWPSALMLAWSIPALFAVGWMLGGWPVAYVASALYALNPAVLLNGRRAMFEGGLLLFAILVIFMALWFSRERRWPQAVAFGVAGGLALSAKHTAIFALAGVFLPLFVRFLFEKSNADRIKAIRLVMSAGFIALAVFYVLHPIWWGDPVSRAGQVLEARSDLLTGQTAAFGGYNDFFEQTFGFWRQSFAVTPQYFEVPVWADYIGEQITAHELSLWSGVHFGVAGGLILTVLSGFGIFAIIRESSPERWLFLGFAVVVALSLWLMTPIEWGRYYLLAHPVIAVLSGLGAMTLWRRIPFLAQDKERVG